MTDKLQVPDIEEMFSLIDEIYKINKNKLLLDIEIKFFESETVKLVTTDTNYFQSGKPPSMAFIDATWKYTGIGNSLVEKRKELAILSAELDWSKAKLQTYRDLIDLYRTQSANERISIV